MDGLAGQPLDWLSTSVAADAAGGRGVVALPLGPLAAGSVARGRISTCAVAPNDNLFVRHALEQGPAGGEILVVAGAAQSAAAVLGGLVAEALVARGFRALVTDGLIRDSGEVAAAGLLTWCRGTTPLGPAKNGPGSIGHAVVLGGVTVQPGDFLVADVDGVVIWPAAGFEALLAAAHDRETRDRGRAAALRSTGRLD